MGKIVGGGTVSGVYDGGRNVVVPGDDTIFARKDQVEILSMALVIVVQVIWSLLQQKLFLLLDLTESFLFSKDNRELEHPGTNFRELVPLILGK